MNKVEFQNYHAGEAARLRLLIASATTPAVKARLTEQAEESERLERICVALNQEC
jgi:hypothetical protein